MGTLNTTGDIGPGSNADRALALVDAADELLDECGLEGLTIRAVLLRTGLARRAFYERFNGKDDLVLAVFERIVRLAAETFRAQAEAVGHPVEALRVVVNGIVLGPIGVAGADGGRRSAALTREHLRLAESRPQELQAVLSPLIALIEEQIAAGVAAGALRPCDPRLQANLVYNFVAATVHVELLAEEGVLPDMDRRRLLAETIWEFCRRAVIA